MSDSLVERKEEQSRKKFKRTLRNMVTLLRHGTDVETVYLTWVNKARKQFVFECHATRVHNLLFQDRTHFSESFLHPFTNLKQALRLEIGNDVAPEALSHYAGEITSKYITILPFINNGETVALTVLESKFKDFTDEEGLCLKAYSDGIFNMLQTYLELSDLSEDESYWINYEEAINGLLKIRADFDAIDYVMRYISSELSNGCVSFLSHGIGGWSVLANKGITGRRLPLGISSVKNSLAQQALESGTSEFSIHFNGNPKRVSTYEPLAKGASMGIPLLLSDRRQGLFIIHEENALLFKESSKHKWSNLVRMLGLNLSAKYPSRITDDIFATRFGLLPQDLWKGAVEEALKNTAQNVANYWVAFVSMGNLSGLRTRHRSEELNQIQQQFLERLSPQNHLENGLMGLYSDYQYLILIEGDSEQSFDHWDQKVSQSLKTPVELPGGKSELINAEISALHLDPSLGSADQIVRKLKTGTGDNNSILKYSLAR